MIASPLPGGYRAAPDVADAAGSRRQACERTARAGGASSVPGRRPTRRSATSRRQAGSPTSRASRPTCGARRHPRRARAPLDVREPSAKSTQAHRGAGDTYRRRGVVAAGGHDVAISATWPRPCADGAIGFEILQGPARRRPRHVARSARPDPATSSAGAAPARGRDDGSRRRPRDRRGPPGRRQERICWQSLNTKAIVPRRSVAHEATALLDHAGCVVALEARS